MLISLAAFVLGLWLGYLGAVEQFRSCRQAPEHGVEIPCPDWVATGN